MPSHRPSLDWANREIKECHSHEMVKVMRKRRRMKMRRAIAVMGDDDEGAGSVVGKSHSNPCATTYQH